MLIYVLANWNDKIDHMNDLPQIRIFLYSIVIYEYKVADYT